MGEMMRGIFPVLQSPFGENDALDIESLRREVDFCVEMGSHGLVYPVLSSEFQFLTHEERRLGVEAVIDANRGRLPVVAGVAGASTAIAVDYARHAAGAGADAIIALPPYVSAASSDELVTYFRAIAAAADRPVFVQNNLPGMRSAFIARLVREIDNVGYVKEEAPPSAHNISGLFEALDGVAVGVFGGAGGRWMLSELERGASGFMPAAPVIEVYVQIWDAWQAGDSRKARNLFDRLLPFVNLAALLGVPVNKEVLVRRGVFATARMRQPGAVRLDEFDLREIDEVLARLQPLLRS